MLPLAPYPYRSIVLNFALLSILAIAGVVIFYYAPDKLWLWTITCLVWLFSLKTKKTYPTEETTSSEKPLHTTQGDNLALAVHLQGAGRLDAAYSVFKNNIDHPNSLAMLYNLARDYEVTKNFQKSTEIYSLIASKDSNYKDIQERLHNASDSRPIPPRNRHSSRASQDSGHLFNQRYSIIKQLGSGANSKVYLARDEKQQNQLVALKVMSLEPETGNRQQHAELLARFLKESSTAAKLNHPNIVRVIDSSQLDHVAYISMEYVAGVSLKQYSNVQRLLPATKIVRLMIQCANALSYAHHAGIIHRDVKPANILYDAALDIAKLSDFGIARVSNSTATVAGSFLGTPSYMSPEQIAGYSLDARSDVYSLGATMFKMLSGHAPYEASTMGELMQAVTAQPHRDITKFNSDLDPSLKKIIDKALSKNPADRYQSMDDMAANLKTCVSDFVDSRDS